MGDGLGGEQTSSVVKSEIISLARLKLLAEQRSQCQQQQLGFFFNLFISAQKQNRLLCFIIINFFLSYSFIYSASLYDLT